MHHEIRAAHAEGFDPGHATPGQSEGPPRRDDAGRGAASAVLDDTPGPLPDPEIREDLADRGVLNLGCGAKHRPDAVNLDVTPNSDPDVVHDLNVRPWPFPDGRFDRVVAFDVVEHLDDVLATMEEIHRVCRPGARVEITVPHFSCANAFTDPTHRHYFAQQSFHYFTGDSRFPFYTLARFGLIRSRIIFYPGLVNRVINKLANRWPQRYELRWAWMFPAWFLSVELEVLKGE